MEQIRQLSNDELISNKKERGSKKYKDFRKSVFERDNYCCQRCGRGKFNMLHYPPLELHHKESFALCQDKRYDMENAVTLCVDCHRLTDNYRIPDSWIFRLSKLKNKYSN